MGDNEPCHIFVKGKIKIKLLNGNHWLLHGVRNDPRLSKNLISAGKLSDEGCVVIFNDKNWKVSKGSIVIANDVKVGTLYLCIVHIVPSTLSIVHIVPSTLIVSEKNECLRTIATIE